MSSMHRVMSTHPGSGFGQRSFRPMSMSMSREQSPSRPTPMSENMKMYYQLRDDLLQVQRRYDEAEREHRLEKEHLIQQMDAKWALETKNIDDEIFAYRNKLNQILDKVKRELDYKIRSVQADPNIPWDKKEEMINKLSQRMHEQFYPEDELQQYSKQQAMNDAIMSMFGGLGSMFPIQSIMMGGGGQPRLGAPKEADENIIIEEVE